MLDAINLNSLSVDKNGRVSFSGLTSGIDFQSAVDAIIAARRIPVDRLEADIAGREAQVAALKELRTLISTLKDSIATLRGAVTFANTGNIFSSKQAFATTSRTDGSTPTTAANLLGVNVTSSAAAGSHTVEIRRVATAHKVGSGTFSSLSTDLGTARGLAANSISGSFQINGKTITVLGTDTLADLRDKINNANTGTSASGVTASVVSVSSTQHYLVLTANKTGTEIAVTDTGSVLADLGISNTNGQGGYRNGVGTSKITTAAGFRDILFDGSQADNAFLISYAQATKQLTLTRGDGTSQTVTLATAAIASGATETATFSNFGVTIVLSDSFNKNSDILVAADTVTIDNGGGGTGAIDPATIKISDSVGNISGIASKTLTFGSLATPGAITVTVGAFTGTFNGTGTGTKTVNLTDGTNTLQVQFDVTSVFNGLEASGSITLNELDNLAAATGSQFENELQNAQTARITADGLTDPDRYESNFIASGSAQLNSLATGITFSPPATPSFQIKVGADTVTVNNIAGTDSVATLVTEINSAITGSGGAVEAAGTQASLVNDGSGVRLVITNTSGAAITLTDTDGLLGALGVDNALVIERSSNTISDLFTGVTLTLFQREEGTTVKIDIEQDLNAIKSQIASFITAYNDVRIFLNTQKDIDLDTGKIADTALLFGSNSIRQTDSDLAGSISRAVDGVSAEFAVFAQIGIKFIDNSILTDPLLADTLKLDEAKLDAALLNNPEDVRRLLAFDYSSSDPQVALLDFTSATSFNSGGYTLNIGGVVASQQTSVTSVLSATATLNDAVNGFGATTSGTLTINGTPVAYDVTTDTLTTLAANISAAGITGVSASVITDSSGKSQLRINSTQNALSVTETGGGDFLTAANMVVDDYLVGQANIGGAADGTDNGTVTVSGRTMTVTNGSTAEGLKLFFTGNANASGIQIDFTVGSATNLFFQVDQLLDTTNGVLENEIDQFEARNKLADSRVTFQLDRLEQERQRLLDRFIRMEAALQTMKSISESIRQLTLSLEPKTN